MEESLSFLEEIHKEFGNRETDIRTYSPLTFAFIGDSVFEMVIRTLIVEKGQRAVNTLHSHKTKIVCAKTQALMIEAIKDELSEEELSVYRRAKNTKLNSVAKNASLQEYRKATGFEALCGYLYLEGNTHRVIELISRALTKLEIEV